MTGQEFVLLRNGSDYVSDNRAINPRGVLPDKKDGLARGTF